MSTVTQKWCQFCFGLVCCWHLLNSVLPRIDNVKFVGFHFWESICTRHHTSLMSSSARPVSRPRDVCAALPRYLTVCLWLSTIVPCCSVATVCSTWNSLTLVPQLHLLSVLYVRNKLRLKISGQLADPVLPGLWNRVYVDAVCCYVLIVLYIVVECCLLDITEESAQQKNGPAESYNPWPGYVFTGKLRPYPVVSLN